MKINMYTKKKWYIPLSLSSHSRHILQIIGFIIRQTPVGQKLSLRMKPVETKKISQFFFGGGSAMSANAPVLFSRV